MRWKVAVFSLGAVVLVCASVAFGVDRMVPSVYQTIQAGIDVAIPDDTVRIAPAVYSGHGNRLLFVSEHGGRLVS
ncbi:MAG: hypothetical protein ACYTEQ_00685 [Planctomycetota bacterium]